MSLLVWNRRFQPAALALGIAAVVLGVTWLDGERFSGHWDHAAAAGAGVVAGTLLVGWFQTNVRVMRAGLLMSTGLWLFAAWVAWIGGANATSVFLALAWAVLAAGSYYLETHDPDLRRA